MWANAQHEQIYSLKDKVKPLLVMFIDIYNIKLNQDKVTTLKKTGGMIFFFCKEKKKNFETVLTDSKETETQYFFF